jgi:archaellum component FlaC
MKNAKVRIAAVALLVFTLIMTSCGASKSNLELADSSSYGINLRTDIALSNGGKATGGTGYEEVGYPKDSPTVAIDTEVQRMIVRNGNMEMLVENIPDVVKRISDLANRNGGYVVTTRQWQTDNRVCGEISIRIPAELFDDIIKQLSDMAIDVSSLTTSTKDVTSEYTDLASELRSLEASEEQLLLIMNKATTVEEVLSVRKELTNIQSKIEVIKGQMKYLEQTSSTSLISITLVQAQMTVTFTASEYYSSNKLYVQFSPTIYGGFAPYKYLWDFGDHETSTDAHPRHHYKKDGTYTVSVTVTDDKGNTYTETREDYLTITNDGWNIGETFVNVWDAFLAFLRVFVTLLIAVLIFSPIWIGIIFLVIFIRKKIRKRKQNKDIV